MTDLQRAAMQAALEALTPLANAHFPDEREVLSDADVSAAHVAIEQLRAALVEHSEDWDRVAALEASLREHMAEIHRLRAALAEPEVEQEPVAKYSDIVSDGGMDPRNKFDHPPRREWQSLTRTEMLKLANEAAPPEDVLWVRDPDQALVAVARAVEVALRERNT